MVSQAKGRLFRRKDGKYLIYVPKALAEDSMFPFSGDLLTAQQQGEDAVPVKISFRLKDTKFGKCMHAKSLLIDFLTISHLEDES